VGVLVEVPVMLSVVWIVNRTKPWYEMSGSLSDLPERSEKE
jgi:ACR3 family arsenite transporter